ncbi:MAG: acyltransferase [Methanobacteriota archaeon]|nr:MAG: acyltransferase [Euryarchaeota archaeon]
MRVGYAQIKPCIGNKKLNLETTFWAVEEAAGLGADLLVLPELCTTGYAFRDREEAKKLAEPVPGPTTNSWAEKTREHGMYMVAGICEIDGNKLFNTAVLVGPHGFVGKYRKTHLFLDEKEIFTPGNSLSEVYTLPEMGARVGILICFDWVFPEVARTLALAGAEILCQPANLVLEYCPLVMRARSIENRVYTITSNRIGEERGLRFIGKSQVTDVRGEILVSSPSDVAEVKVVEIDPNQARDKYITPKNHLFNDRRTEIYNL